MTEEEIIKLSEEKYPGSTKKTGPFGVLLRGKRGAYIQGHTDGYALASQEHREGWVRVDAGKPGMFGKYIVYTQWGCNILWFGFNPEERYYEDRYPEMATNFWRYARPDEAEEIILFDDVTHWMPLPKAPTK